MVGAGFSTPSSIITVVGSVGPALLLCVLGFIFAFCDLFVWLEWGTLYPRSGREKAGFGYVPDDYVKRFLAITAMSSVVSVQSLVPEFGVRLMASSCPKLLGMSN